MTITADSASYVIGLEPKDAVRFLESKGAQVSGSWKTWLDGQHARAFTVANVAKLDVLQDIQTSLATALKDGQTLESWKTGLIPELQKKGWWQRDATTEQLQAAGRVDAQGVIAKGLTPSRLKTIYATNMQSAYMAGRYEQMIDQAGQRPYWEYVAILDNRTRPAHRALNGQIFRYDDGAWGTVFPPNGYRCRCRVRSFSQLDVDKRKLTVGSSDGKLQQVEVPLKGGGTANVTRYVDKSLPGGGFQPDAGFSNNPALTAWQPRLEPMDVQLSRKYVETVLQGPAFEQFVAGKSQGNFPVAVLRQAEQTRLNANTSVAYMSDQTVTKQLREHPELTASDYRRIPDIVDQGEAYVQGSNRLLFLYEGDVVYRLALKVTKSLDEVYVIHMIRTTRQKAQREIRDRLQRN